MCNFLNLDALVIINMVQQMPFLFALYNIVRGLIFFKRVAIAFSAVIAQLKEILYSWS